MIIAVTYWQWIAELAIGIVMFFFHGIVGSNRALDHILLLFLAFLSFALLPTFYLLCDEKFRHLVNHQGWKEALKYAIF